MSRNYIQRTLKNFFENTTIHACNFITMNHIFVYEKIFWALVNVVTITLTIFWIHNLSVWYMNDSTFVNFDGTIPIRQVEYPGIAICNVNKISKRRALEFAKQLSPFMRRKNISAIMEDIKLIGNLYDFNTYGEERFRYFQEILDKYDNTTDFSDVTPRLVQLTTPCEEILAKCKLESKEHPCQELFLTRMTFDGFCCVFNYVRPGMRTHLYHQNSQVPTEPQTPHGPGTRYGLQVLLRNDLDDYFYTDVETTGFKVHFFHCKDYPDLLSGSLKEFLVGIGKETLFGIDVDVIKSARQIRSLPVHSRKCRFESETRTSFGIYRQSDCLVECKLRSMQALCNCIPFVMPIEPSSSRYRSVCTLIDIPCVNQYFRKWTRYYPKDVDVEELELERYDSLNCDCLPTCDNVNYNIYTNTFPIQAVNQNFSKINVYFLKGYGNLYKVDMTVTWFEIISAYGGLMSLVMGGSLISITEVVVLICKIVFFLLGSVLRS